LLWPDLLWQAIEEQHDERARGTDHRGPDWHRAGDGHGLRPAGRGRRRLRTARRGRQGARGRADVSIEDDVQALVDGTVKTFGQLDVAVNNAGYTGSPGPLTAQTLEAYNAVFDTNVRGVFFSLKHELRVMTGQGFGSIVNLSSTLGERGGAGAALYSASKHAVNGFTRSAALEVAAQGIRVNAIAPGPVATGGLDRFAGGQQGAAAMAATVPAGRLGDPSEIADVITFLASDAARFLTGQIVAVNGGKTAA
jgi:NAD(P)-dependent dehydrogenase (short-subunit alcohol dehydrogenase family)